MSDERPETCTKCGTPVVWCTCGGLDEKTSNEIAERVLELDALADPGSWRADEYRDILRGDGCVSFENSSTNDWEAEFIAYTRTAAPALAHEVIALHTEMEKARERIAELIEQADATYLPYREMVAQARADADKVGMRLYRTLEAVKKIRELANYDIDHEEDGNTYQIEAIASAVLKENE